LKLLIWLDRPSSLAEGREVKGMRNPRLIPIFDPNNVGPGKDGQNAHRSRAMPHRRTIETWLAHHPFVLDGRDVRARITSTTGPCPEPVLAAMTRQ